MVTDVEFESRDWSPNPIVCQIMYDGLRQVVCVVPCPRRWPPPRLSMRYWGGLHLISLCKILK